MLATVLFTDIVDSTGRASALGDAAWRNLLDAHDDMVRRQLDRFRGREIKTTGDGVLATFDGPARAIRCAQTVREGASRLGLDIRAGLHTGEIERRGSDVGGIAVHIGQRVSALAASGEVLVSSTVKDLVAGARIEFEDRGEYDLKGVTGSWKLFAVKGLTRLISAACIEMSGRPGCADTGRPGHPCRLGRPGRVGQAGEPSCGV